MKNVVLTGVSSGIGFAIAEDLLALGYRVFGSVRKEADAQSLGAKYPDTFVPLIFDVTDPTALAAAADKVRIALGGQGLTALVNNAGIMLNGPLMHQPLAEIRRTFDVNVFGMIAVTQAFLPLLGADRAAAFPPGRVINIVSVSGAISVPFMGAYAGSKHAIEGITQSLRRELKLYGIEVAAIEPGFIRTKLFDKTVQHSLQVDYDDTDYAASWRQFNLSTKAQEANAKGPDVVIRALLHAIEARKPRTHYPLDPIWHIGRWLPDRAFDRLIFKALGINQMMRRESVRAR